MDRAKILILEDDESMRLAMNEILKHSYDVTVTESAEDALRLIASKNFDLIVADLGLPHMDGHHFCATLKAQEKTAQIPIIIYSARSDISDKLVGFSVGIRDYIQKPADMREVKARIEIHLRTILSSQKSLTVGPFRMDFSSQKVWLTGENKEQEVSITSLEFRLLQFLMNHLEQVFSRQQLLDKIWGDTRHVNDRSVDAVISKLRHKIEPHSGWLQSVRGSGYRFCKPDTRN